MLNYFSSDCTEDNKLLLVEIIKLIHLIHHTIQVTNPNRIFSCNQNQVLFVNVFCLPLFFFTVLYYFPRFFTVNMFLTVLSHIGPMNGIDYKIPCSMVVVQILEKSS